jgi:glycosyltransferase involved in cell wall biosynthesis
VKTEIGPRPPLISIVMPTYNHNCYIEEALDSAHAQEVEDLEVVVVDDGSDTPVDAIVRAKVPNASLIRRANAGPSAARNAGIARARGTFIAFLDADDFWTPTALQRLLKGFRDAPGAGIVQGNLRRFVTPGDAPSIQGSWIGPAYQGFNVGTLLVRREVLLEIGLFDETLRRSEDVDLFIRCSERRIARLVIPDIVLGYRKYEHSAGRSATYERGIWIEHLRRSMARRRAAAPPAERGTPAAEPVSVILTVCNGMPYLLDAVAAIRQQTLPPHEIVAVVGSSDDATLSYLQSATDIRVIEQSGTGLAAARNSAVRAARCPLVAFCDHDDIWHPAKLEKQVAVLSQFSAPAACIVNFQEFSEPGAPVAVTDPFRDVPTLAWTPSALLAHRDVFMSVGPFDPALGLACDADWFRRLRQSDIPIGVAGRVLLRKRRHASNLSREPQANRAAMFKMLRKARSELMYNRLSDGARRFARDREGSHR